MVLTFLSARVELDEKDESCEALIFWWGRQICPPPWLCRNGGGERAVTARVCVWEFGFSGQSVYRLSTVHGDAQTKYFREGIIV